VRRSRRAEILAATLAPPPQQLGVTHWSSRLLAAELGISHSTVARVWAERDIRPWQTQTFAFSTDPQLDACVRYVVGLYLDPPAHAIVVCVDERSQGQALQRAQPVRSVAPGRVERPTHDDLRHGIITLFAALEVATGRVTDALKPRQRHIEFLAFLKLVARAHPRRQLHVVLDNSTTHKHAKVQAWLASHPRVQLHFTPTYTWLNLVEVFFSIVERQALRRGDFASVAELVAAIVRFCDGWNRRCQPFTWTKDADQTLGKLQGVTTPRRLPVRARAGCKMAALADLVGLANPAGELLIQLLGRANSKLVHHQALGVGRSPADPRVLHAPLQVQIPVKAAGFGLGAGEPSAAALEGDPRLGDRVVERPARLDQLDEPTVEGNDRGRPVAQVVLHGPLAQGHAPAYPHRRH